MKPLVGGWYKPHFVSLLKEKPLEKKKLLQKYILCSDEQPMVGNDLWIISMLWPFSFHMGLASMHITHKLMERELYTEEATYAFAGA